MARTAPAPNIPPIPGMNPCTWLAGGGAGGGGSGGKGGKGGKGDGGADGDDGDKDAEGGGKNANGGKGCGDPVCPITGKMFLEVLDFSFIAVKSLRFIRHYNSRRSDVAGSFGYGWTHPFGWRLEERRRCIFIFDERGDRQKFRYPRQDGDPTLHPFGWQLYKVGQGYRLTKPDGDRLTFEKHRASGAWLLTQVADVHGNATLVHYDERGRFFGLTDSEGRRFVANLDELGRVTRLSVATDAEQQGWLEVGRYRYDAAGDLIEFIDACGFSWGYRYTEHLLVEHRTGGGLSYLYRYDGNTHEAYCVESWGEYVGRDDPALYLPISKRKPDPLSAGSQPKGINYIRLTYIKDQYYSEVDDGLGGLTRFFGDSFGRVVKQVSANNSLAERDFDGTTGAIAAQGGSAAPTTTLLDDYGLPCGFVRPDGSSVRHTVTEPLTRETFDSATGSNITTHYDEFARPIFRKFPDGTFENDEYDRRGLLVSSTDRSGGTTRYVWDGMGNLVEVRAPTGSVERRVFDYLGRCIEFISAAGESTTFRFDARNEVVYKRTHDGTEAHVSYDANRKITTFQIAGRVRRFEYGGLNWLIREIAADGSTTDYRYDLEGKIVWVRNARGQEYHVTRDTAGQIIRVVDFEGLVEERRYDGNGNVSGLNTPLGITTREYDPQGRLAAVTTPDDSIALGYDRRGANIEITNAAVKLEQQHDALGRVVRERQGAHETEVSWKNGWLHEVSSDVGVALRHEIGQGALQLLQAGASTLQFIFPRACESVAFLGERLARRDQYDVQGKRVRTVFARFAQQAGLEEPAIAQPGGPDQLLCIEYAYNEHGELVQERRSDGRMIDYLVDVTGRIVEKSVSHQGRLTRQEKLRYDAVGTPLLDGVSFDAQMRPAALNGETFSYDRAGRLTRRITDRGVWNYEWDFVGNLIRAAGPEYTVELTYDGRGRRMGKRIFTLEGELKKEWSYVWSNQTLLHEVDHTSGWTRTYLRKPDSWQPFGHVDSLGDEERAYFYVSDSTGLPDLALDATGAIVWSAERTVYGDVEVNPSSKIEVRARFAGQQYDEDLGLTYNRMRWYDPRTGQYLSPDPLSLDGGVAPRNYVPNPTFFVDPMGQMGKNADKPVWPPDKTAPTPVGNHPMGDDNPDKPLPVATRGEMDTLGPGPFATKGTKTDDDGNTIPGFIDCPKGKEQAAGSEFSSDTRAQIDQAGAAYGCHGCGSKNPLGPEHPQEGDDLEADQKNNHFVPDHQPPAVMHTPRDGAPPIKVPPGGVKLYPHCRKCASIQGGQMSALKKEKTPAELNAMAQAAFQVNKNL